jgi:hypothetical protein
MEAAIVRPHWWPFSTHYLGQPRLCLSTIIGTDGRPLSALAHPLRRGCTSSYPVKSVA